MAAHKQVISLHFSFGPHFSKGHAKNARSQLEQKGPFDLYSPEVAIPRGQSGFYIRNLKIKNELIREANLEENRNASRIRVPSAFFKALGESHDFGDFAQKEFELCFQKGLPYVPISVHEIPADRMHVYSIAGRAEEDIAWERDFVANLRPNLAGALEQMQDIWPSLIRQDSIHIFCRFGTEHAPLYALSQTAYPGDPSTRFSYSFDRKSDEKAFMAMVGSGNFEHGNLESRMRWMEYVAKNPGLSGLVDDLKQLPRIILNVFSRN
jgi:hypothetical protein